MEFLEIWLLCALGYTTHGILDAATSYGTFLLWPFSDERFAFNVISVIDPLFTVPVASLVMVGVLRKDGRWARGALGWAVLYLALGAWQHHAACRATPSRKAGVTCRRASSPNQHSVCVMAHSL